MLTDFYHLYLFCNLTVYLETMLLYGIDIVELKKEIKVFLVGQI